MAEVVSALQPNKSGDTIENAAKEFLRWEKDHPESKLVEKEEELVRLYRQYNLATRKKGPWTALYSSTILRERSFRLRQAVSRLVKIQDRSAWKHYSRQQRLTYLQEISEMYRLDYQEWVLLNKAASGGLPTGLNELVQIERDVQAARYREFMAEARRQLGNLRMADWVVGIFPSDHSGTGPDVIKAVAERCGADYPDQNIVIVAMEPRQNPDAENALQVPDPERRNIHVLSLFGVQEDMGKGWNRRVVLELAQQLQAHALFLGAGLLTTAGHPPGKSERSLPSIRAVCQPILEGFDCVIPAYRADPWDGILTDHLCHPLITAIYGKRLRRPIAGEISLSHSFVQILLRDPEVWFTDIGAHGVDHWITSEAIVNEVKITEALLSDQQTWPPRMGRPPRNDHASSGFQGGDFHRGISDPFAGRLEAAFKQVAGILFDQVMKNSSWWLSRASEPRPDGQEPGSYMPGDEAASPPAPVDWKATSEGFEAAFSEGRPTYEAIFSAEVCRELGRLSGAQPGELVFPSTLWAMVLFEFLLEYAFCDPLVKEELTKEQMLDALFPIYFARVGSFARQIRGLASFEVERLVAEQADEFVRRRKGFVDRWQSKADDHRTAQSQPHDLMDPAGKRFARLIREEIDGEKRKVLYLEPLDDGDDRRTFLAEAKRYARILGEIEGRPVTIAEVRGAPPPYRAPARRRPRLTLPPAPFEEDYLVLPQELALTHPTLKALYCSPDTRVVQLSRADVTSLPWVEFDEGLIEEIREDILRQAERQNLHAASPLYFEEKVKTIADLIHQNFDRNFRRYAAYPRLCAEATLIGHEVFGDLGYYVDTLWTRDLHYFLLVSSEETELIVDLTSDQFSLNRFSFLALEIETATSLLREGRREALQVEETGRLIDEISQQDFTGRSLPERDSIMITLQKLRDEAFQAGISWEEKLDPILTTLLEIQTSHQMRETRKSLEDIYRAAIVRVEPYRAVKRTVTYRRPEEGRGRLRVGNHHYDLSRVENVFVVGAGKAALGMARALAEVLGERITAGILCVPGEQAGHPTLAKKFRLFGAGYPEPNPEGVRGAREIRSLLRRAGRPDMVFVLISSGAAELMCCPGDGLTLEDLRQTRAALRAASATLSETDTVIKHLDALKGGKLAKTAADAGSVITLVLSDEPGLGDEPALIAGGPTIGDESTFSAAIEALERHALLDRVPTRVQEFLQSGTAGFVAENPRLEDPLFDPDRFDYHLVADSDAALDHAAHRAEKLGYRSSVISWKMEGEVHEVAREVLRRVKAKKHATFPQALLFGGKPIVRLGKAACGQGGRMSTLAVLLAAGLAEERLDEVTILAADTDGVDGNSELAGGMVSSQTIPRAASQGLRYAETLRRFDSATFLKKLGLELAVGNTGTDVGDIVVALVHPSPEKGRPGLSS